MKGLLLKDWYVLVRQMKLFGVMIILFALIPGMSMTAFAVMYASMLPYSSLAYDERSKWEMLAGMLPYKTGEIVLSKYVLGWITTGCAALLALGAQVAVGFAGAGLTSEQLWTTGLTFCIALIIMAITLPLVFRFGVEKGRMLFLVMFVFIMVGAVTLTQGIIETGSISAQQLASIGFLAPLAAIVFQAASVLISIRLYQKRSK